MRIELRIIDGAQWELAHRAARLALRVSVLAEKLEAIAKRIPSGKIANHTLKERATMSTSTDPLVAAAAALDQIDAATTEAGAAASAIQTNITNLLAQIAGAPSLAEAQAIATQAQAEAAKLQPIADQLKAMGSSGTASSSSQAPAPTATPSATPAPASSPNLPTQ